MKRQPWFWPVKLFFKRIAGRELWLWPDVSRPVTVSPDGWQYLAAELGPDSIVYSLGIGDQVDFDIDLIRRFGLTVHAFDPTPFAEQWVRRQKLPPQFLFYPWAAAAAEGWLRLYRRVNTRGARSAVMWTADRNAGDADDFIDAPAYTIGAMMRRLGHHRIDMLKMDVEGAEYGILEGLARGERLPRQLLVEYHHRFPGIGKRRTADSIAALRELGYRIFAISATGREIGFVRD